MLAQAIPRRPTAPGVGPPPPPPTPPSPSSARKVAAAPTPTPAVAESQGRSSATYASAQPHVIPQTRAPKDLGDVPAVIVAEDTVPGPPPKMTVPMGAPVQVGSGPHQAADMAHSPGPMPVMQKATVPLAAVVPRGGVVRTARRHQPTVVVRRKTPSSRQKLIVFAVMLVLVTACGVVAILWHADALFGAAKSAAPPAVPTVSAPVPAPAPDPPLNPALTATASAPPTAAPPPPKKGARPGRRTR